MANINKFQRRTIFLVSASMIVIGIYVIGYFHTYLVKEDVKIEDKWTMEFVFSGYMIALTGIFSLARFVVMSDAEREMWVSFFIATTIAVYTLYPSRYYDGDFDDIVGMMITHIGVELSFVLFLDFKNISLKGVFD